MSGDAVGPPSRSDGYLTRIIRPGPPSLAPELVPGGVVIHVYSVPTQRLLVIRLAHDRADVARHAEADAAEAEALMWPDDLGVCLVAYDGDTGERIGAWPARGWVAVTETQAWFVVVELAVVALGALIGIVRH
jgi:hypothetical protein